MLGLEHELQQPAFWIAVGKVIWIDALLSGDNALVIALACRGLAPAQRFWGITLGALCAVLMRVAFTGGIATLMTYPYLRIVGGICLLYVAIKMCLPDGDESGVQAHSRLFAAVRVIVLADLIMSLDNMVAVAAVAKGSWLILGIGLVISIPLIVTGATLITMVLSKLPMLIWLGAGLLGWLAGELLISDPSLPQIMRTAPDWFYGGVGACLVVAAAYILWRLQSEKVQST